MVELPSFCFSVLHLIPALFQFPPSISPCIHPSTLSQSIHPIVLSSYLPSFVPSSLVLPPPVFAPLLSVPPSLSLFFFGISLPSQILSSPIIPSVLPSFCIAPSIPLLVPPPGLHPYVSSSSLHRSCLPSLTPSLPTFFRPSVNPFVKGAK